jgi:diguanylate cyclase
MPIAASPASPQQPASRRDRLYRRIYPLRILGMGLGGLAVGSVLHAQHDGWPSWALMVATCLLWPHVAFGLAARSRDRFRAERRNLLVDSAIAGMWVPLMHFNLLPSIVLTTVTTFDKLSTGVQRLWLHSLPAMFGAALVAWLLTRTTPHLESSFAVVLCTLPLLVVHTLSSSISSYRLIRTVSEQNRQLEQLRRIDVQTGLSSREHWQERADAALRRFHAGGEPACLLMIDIDRFKSINDSYGHTIGDEVIAAVGRIVRSCVRTEDSAGRYGGDEFAIVCGNAASGEAWQVAERIRARVERLELPDLPQVRLSASIGVAQARARHATVRDWMDDADAALYRAKSEGRNQVAEDPGMPTAAARA